MTGAEVQNWLTAEAIGNPTLGALAHSWDSTRISSVSRKCKTKSGPATSIS